MKPLDNIRVLDITYYLPGPFAAMRLADFGADVVKIEPLEGDPAFSMSGGAVHRANNRGKKIINIDLKSASGKALLEEHIQHADVLLESFRTGVMDRLGFSYERVKELNPLIVYCSMTGYGVDSPLSSFGSHDLNYLALSGVLSQLTDSKGKPIVPKNTLADYVGGFAVSEAILAALVQRFRTGEGSRLQVSITDAMATFQGTNLEYLASGLSEHGIPEIDGSYVAYNIYETKDARFVALGALEKKFWKNLCLFAEHPEWESLQFERIESTMHKQISEFFMSRTWEKWLLISLETDFCVTPIMYPAELNQHPHWLNRENLVIMKR
ncbi:CaiB/BaiF CoA-transferase family protein [Paenisporosarcina sp. TG20]|uniref:CaiB/BaiF CoA transferase family protein n=1 Tax=Paenisporosarcina sp. TG20 TaxID=1211706 RepID=UPI0002DC33A5|nr:CoA transferase [Paenisporosarcina sp. TG20]